METSTIHTPYGTFRIEYVPRIGPYKVFEYIIYNTENKRCFEDRIILNTYELYRTLGLIADE